MVDTIAILYRDADVEEYKKGDFRITSYRTGSPVVSALGAMGCAEMQPAVYMAKSGKLLDFSINGDLLDWHIVVNNGILLLESDNVVEDWVLLADECNPSNSGGTITHAKAANAKAYGALVPPEDILSGRVDAPASLDLLYKELTALSASAMSAPEQ